MAKEGAPIIQISRRGVFIWIGLVIFISFWMFVLGVIVGRGMTPVNLESGKFGKGLADIKAKMLAQEEEQASHQEAGQSADKPELEFYEALKHPGRETGFKPVKPKDIPKPKHLPDPPAAIVRKVPAPPDTKVKKLPHKSASTPASKKVARPQTAARPAGGHFSIQVAAVQDIKAAGKLVHELRRKGYQAYQIRSKIAGKGVWYRVRVGEFNDRGATEKVLRKLKGDKYGGMVVSTN